MFVHKNGKDFRCAVLILATAVVGCSADVPARVVVNGNSIAIERVSTLVYLADDGVLRLYIGGHEPVNPNVFDAGMTHEVRLNIAQAAIVIDTPIRFRGQATFHSDGIGLGPDDAISYEPTNSDSAVSLVAAGRSCFCAGSSGLTQAVEGDVVFTSVQGEFIEGTVNVKVQGQYPPVREITTATLELGFSGEIVELRN